MDGRGLLPEVTALAANFYGSTGNLFFLGVVAGAQYFHTCTCPEHLASAFFCAALGEPAPFSNEQTVKSSESG